MHELAIAQSIIDTAQREAERHSARVVTKIKLRLGEFTGVDRDALRFALEVAKRDTAAHEAEMDIDIVRLEAKCRTCRRKSFLFEDPLFLCPDCGEPVDVISGREMRIEYIEVE